MKRSAELSLLADWCGRCWFWLVIVLLLLLLVEELYS